ncbi:MAG: DNA internalization-related competence protein ComEC/Rec2 [Clostridiales bacterium]|nr:DNA internalization-related competence protein ComEC/Rec2 [Clostridiales bacterium]
MKLRIKRPIIWVTVAYIIGILIAVYMKWELRYFYIVLLPLLVLGGAGLKVKWKGLYLVLFFSIFILIGIANAYIHNKPDNGLEDLVGQAVNAYGQVAEIVSSSDSKTSFILDAYRISHIDKDYVYKGKIRITIYHNSPNHGVMPFKTGDWIEVRGTIEKPQGMRNPRGFDYRAYLARRGIHYIIGTASRNILSIDSGNLPWPKSWIESIRKYMEGVFDTYIGGMGSKLMKAMIIGQRWSLPSELREEFTNTGIAHILAISGLHVGFVVLLLSWISNRLKLSPKVTFFIQGAALGVYCIVVGGSSSVVRATIMTIILLGGKVVGRKPDPLNSLSLAAFIILLFRPLEVFEVGFQLSFSAVAGIVLFNELLSAKLSKLDKLPLKVGEAIAIMLSAQLGVWPLIAYHFNTFSIISFIANLILVPVAGVIVILGLILLLTAAIFPLIGAVIGWWLWLLCQFLIEVNKWLSSFTWSSIRVVSPGILLMTVYYSILLILSQERPLWVKRPWRTSLILTLIVFLLLAIKPVIDNQFKVIFVDVGQGDCIYIKTPDEKHILVDGGGRPEGVGDYDVGAEVVVPFLLKNGVKKLDLVVMSHGHDDHMGGLIPVIKEIKVDAFMEFPPRQPSERYKELKDLIDNKDIKCIHAIGRQTYKVGKYVFIDVVYPTSNYEVVESLYNKNENNLSLVLRVRYQRTSVMLTGDIEGGVESYLSSFWKDSVSILKVAHHGSNTSSTDKWLEVIKPRIAVIQSGKNNFGHPNPEVIEKLEEHGAIVYKNHKNGAIICVYDKGKWRINTVIKEKE